MPKTRKNRSGFNKYSNFRENGRSPRSLSNRSPRSQSNRREMTRRSYNRQNKRIGNDNSDLISRKSNLNESKSKNRSEFNKYSNFRENGRSPRSLSNRREMTGRAYNRQNKRIGNDNSDLFSDLVFDLIESNESESNNGFKKDPKLRFTSRRFHQMNEKSIPHNIDSGKSFNKGSKNKNSASHAQESPHA